jgi:uncharacterized FlgJ-related protein
MNTFDYREKAINEAIESGIIELLEPYSELPERYKNVLTRIIDEGGVEKYCKRTHVNDRLKSDIRTFVK